MAKTRANEDLLGRLHQKLAEVMVEALEPLLVYGDDEDPEKVTDTLKVNNPALFTAIAKFLKDNEITSIPEAGNELDALRQKFADQRSRRVLPKPEEVDPQFGRTTPLQ